MPLRVAAHKRIASDPLVNLPNKGGPLTPVGVRLVASVGFDESNPRSKRRGTTAQYLTKRLPQTLELMAKLITLSDYLRFSLLYQGILNGDVSPDYATLGYYIAVSYTASVSRVSEVPANSLHLFGGKVRMIRHRTLNSPIAIALCRRLSRLLSFKKSKNTPQKTISYRLNFI